MSNYWCNDSNNDFLQNCSRSNLSGHHVILLHLIRSAWSVERVVAVRVKAGEMTLKINQRQ
jgi:hypothetical protein